MSSLGSSASDPSTSELSQSVTGVRYAATALQ